jgi:hypothetical protein
MFFISVYLNTVPGDAEFKSDTNRSISKNFYITVFYRLI